MRVPHWINVDAIAPAEVRDRVKLVIDRINALRPDLELLAADAGAALKGAYAAEAAVDRDLGETHGLEVADGVAALLSELSGSSELYTAMLALSDLVHLERIVELDAAVERGLSFAPA